MFLISKIQRTFFYIPKNKFFKNRKQKLLPNITLIIRLHIFIIFSILVKFQQKQE